MHDLCIFIRYLVSITQALKDTLFRLDNWCDCGILFIYLIFSIEVQILVEVEVRKDE
jgi:hypothetical protein